MPEELTGQAKLFDALTTKGTAFTRDERRKYGLLGLLPTAEKTLDQQVEHCWHEFSTRRDDLDKHIYLRALQDRNETLFYRVLRDHIPETMPIVYTPTVGEACQRFSEIYRRPRGLFVSYPDRDRLARGARQPPAPRRRRDRGDRRAAHPRPGRPGHRRDGHPDRQALALHPHRRHRSGPHACRSCSTWAPTTSSCSKTRSISAGATGGSATTSTTRSSTSSSPPCTKQLPDVLLQWEDFATAHALPILERYRDKLLTFNDDIQGTAAVAVGALHGASKVAGRPLSQQQVVMLGAGSAGIGVLDMVQREMMAQGLSERGRGGADLGRRHRRPAHRRPHGPVAGTAEVRPAGEPRRRTGACRARATGRCRAPRRCRRPDGAVHRGGRLHRGHRA